MEVFATMSERLRLGRGRGPCAAASKRSGSTGSSSPTRCTTASSSRKRPSRRPSGIKVTTSVLVVVSAQSHGRRPRGVGSPGPLRRALRARDGLAGPRQHRRPLLDAVDRRPCRACASTCRRCARSSTCWQNGRRRSRSKASSRTASRSMQPFFDPGPLAERGAPPLLMGGVGPRMTALAGEVSDGLMTHPTNSSARYLREVVKPRARRRRCRVGERRPVAACPIMAAGFVATGVDAAAVAAKREWARELLTFLYSTPSYWPSLDLFGYPRRRRGVAREDAGRATGTG